MATNNCTGDCMKCPPFQRQYCASQIAYNNMGLVSSLVELVKSLSDDVKTLSKKIETQESHELINPIENEDEDDE